MTPTGVLFAALLLQTDTPVDPDVTVTARKLPVKPIRDAIGYFQRHCFDASRLTGRASTPRADTDWHELSAAERVTYGLAGKPDRAFGSAMPDGQALVLTFSETPLARDLLEQRCTLIVSGGEQGRFRDRVAAMFRGPGTSKHVGDPNGVPVRPGWTQLLWAAIPSIRSADWRVYTTSPGRDTWVQVIDPNFFRSMEYVRADLRMSRLGPPLTVLTLIHTRRPIRTP